MRKTILLMIVYFFVGWFFVILTVGLLTGCTEITEILCNDWDASVDGDTMSYPTNNHGYKPLLRELNGGFEFAEGNILAPFELTNSSGALVTHEDLFDLELDLIVILMSLRDCQPCYDAYAGLTDIQIYLWDHGIRARMFAVVGNADMQLISSLASTYDGTFLADPHNSVFVGPWELDKWPEQIRGFPSFVFVDGRTMRILTDTVGYTNSTLWMGKQLTKITVAQAAQGGIF